MLTDQMTLAHPEVRRVAAQLLDEISRPMTVRELDDAFRLQGLSRSQRRPIVKALKHLTIIAIVREPAA